jgi:predicted site-specific integrase-resolvase
VSDLHQTITVEQLAEVFGISPARVRKYCKEGDWPYIVFGRNIRFTPEQVAAITELHSRKPDTANRTGRRRLHSTRRRAA